MAYNFGLFFGLAVQAYESTLVSDETPVDLFLAGEQERGQIVEFLKALTDDRVRFERAPFDHPSICVPVGYAENPPGVLRPDASSGGTSAADSFGLIPAVGSRGHTVPLQTFAELLAGVGRDGTRAHTLNQSCVP